MRSGKSEKAEALLQKTIERRMIQWEEMPERWEFSFDLASAYSVLGNTDKAYQWLFTSVLTGYPGHLWNSDPVFSNVHDKPAFRKLIEQARIRVENEYEYVSGKE